MSLFVVYVGSPLDLTLKSFHLLFISRGDPEGVLGSLFGVPQDGFSRVAVVTFVQSDVFHDKRRQRASVGSHTSTPTCSKHKTKGQSKANRMSVHCYKPQQRSHNIPRMPRVNGDGKRASLAHANVTKTSSGAWKSIFTLCLYTRGYKENMSRVERANLS